MKEVDAAAMMHIHGSLWNHKLFRYLPPKLESPPGFWRFSLPSTMFGCEHVISFFAGK